METNDSAKPLKSRSIRRRVSLFAKMVRTVPFAALWTVVLAVWGVYQYADQSDRELRKVIFAEQLQTYKDLTLCASELATWDNDSIITKAYAKKYIQFRQLMISKATLLQDVAVEAEVKNFWRLIERYEPNSLGVTQRDLVNSTISMSFASREALQRIWGSELPELERIGIESQQERPLLSRLNPFF